MRNAVKVGIGIVAAAGAMGLTVAMAQSDETCVEVPIGVEVPEFGVTIESNTICGTTTTLPPTTTVPPTTTSTVPPTTSTTVPPTTTTTVPPTTTTLPPPTTTTTLKVFELPPTLPFPEDEEFNGGESFRLQIQCATDPDERDPNSEPFDCPMVNGRAHYADLDYFGHGMPYLYSDAIPGNHDHAWWVPGDRQGYACAYGFMYDRHPNPFGHPDIIREGTFIARATVVRPFEAGYGKVNDVYMEEGQRYYDGSHASEGQEINSEDCQEVSLDDFDYDTYQPHGPDEIRIGLLTPDGELADIRDFTDVQVSDVGHFEYVGLEGDRATVVFILEGKVSHVIYYDGLNGGRIVVEVGGVVVDQS